MTAASSEPSAQGPARRLGLLYSALACLLVFVGAAWWSWRYTPLPDPFEPAESRTFWQRLTTPIEENAFRRLPVITGDLNGVFALKGTDHVWAVGDGGLIVHSADGGESWEQQSEIDWSPAVPKETEPAAENDAFGLIRSAHAGEQPSSPAETAEVQRLLHDLGYYPGPSDGKPREITRGAIEQFQRDAGLPVDGKLTEALRERLQKESAARNATAQPAAGTDSTPAESSKVPPEPGVSGSSGGGLPEPPSPSRAHLRAVAFADERLGIAVGYVVLQTLDGGAHWRRVASGSEAVLTSVAFANARRALAVGLGGTVLLSTDAGESWRPVEYRRYPAPLFLALSGAALLFGLLGARRAWREVPIDRRTVSVTDLFASDRPLRPGERDALDLGAIARGMSRFLRNRQTEPPLTIAVTGEWGSGKSSLMGLLYEDLRGRGFRPVWFNAWHHQRGEHLLASLYANIRAQALPRAWTPEGLGFRWDRFWIRARRHWLSLYPGARAGGAGVHQLPGHRGGLLHRARHVEALGRDLRRPRLQGTGRGVARRGRSIRRCGAGPRPVRPTGEPLAAAIRRPS